jgi:hypothetical protein
VVLLMIGSGAKPRTKGRAGEDQSNNSLPVESRGGEQRYLMIVGDTQTRSEGNYGCIVRSKPKIQ